MSPKPIDTDFLVPGGALAGPLFARLLREEQAPEPKPGSVVGHFCIEAVIGRGGSSVVYRARRDDGTFAQTVALKVLRPDPRRRESFERERNILGGFHHPGIALILDGGETPAGEAWYAMEYVIGERIDLWCRDRRAAWRQRLDLVLAVCDAVHYAHSRLIVHQDIKPANILVDESGIPRLLDFGISRSVREPTVRGGDIALTPGIASPEQYAGAPASTATDVFQLGRLLQTLFAPTAGVAMPNADRRNLDAVIAHATAATPEERYSGVAELRADLGHVLVSRPAQAIAWPWVQRMRYFERRNRLPLSIALGAAVVLAGSVAFYTIALRTERDHAAEQARSALISNEVLANLFRTAAPTLPLAEQESAAQVLDRGADTTLRRLGDAPQQRAIAAAVLASTYLDLSGYDKARALLDAALKDGELPAEGYDLERAQLLLLRARVSLEDGALDAAQAQLDAAAARLALRPDRTLDHAALAAQRVVLQTRRGDAAGANAAREALIARMQADGLDGDPLYAAQLRARSSEYAFANRYAQARGDARRAQEILAARYGPTSPQALSAQREEIWLALSGGGDAADIDRRIGLQRDAVRDSFGEASLEFAAVLSFEGIVASQRNDWTQARLAFEHAYATARAQLGADASELASYAHNVADAAVAQGDAAAALPLYEEALRIRRLRYPENDQPVLVNRLQIARVQCDLGRYGDAERGFADVRLELGRRIGASHAYLASAAAMHVDCLLKQKQVTQARSMFDDAFPASVGATLSGSAKERVSAVRLALEKAESDRP